MLLTVEYNSKQEAVEIYCDREGIDFLIDGLNLLRQRGGHDHLMTESWGGYELSEEKQGAENELINHLRLTVVPD